MNFLTFIFFNFIIKGVNSNKLEKGMTVSRFYIGNETDHFINNSFSIHFVTHKKRIEALTSQLKLISYGQCPHLKHIYITWVDKKNPLPTLKTYQINSSSTVPITIIQSTTQHIIDRFIIPDDIETETVLIMDDDQNIQGIDIDNAFIIYKENHYDNRIFGYRTRLYSMGKYYTNNYKGPYNIVLMNFAFLSVDMLKEYNSNEYKDLRDNCIKINNCDDILMNYIVSHKWKMSPIAIQIPSFNTKLIGNHFEKPSIGKREKCCAEFDQFFGYDVLGTYETKYYLKKVW